MDFADALKHLKAGARLFRKGWNGANMYIYLVDGSTFEVNRAPLDKFFKPGTEVTYLPHLDMYTASGECVPWLASQTDILAEDWAVIV